MKLVLSLFVLASCATSCASLSQPLGAERVPLSELEYPGYLDMGVGFAVAFNTRNGDNNDASGTLVSVKAYPAGRWYAKRKSEGARQLSLASAKMVEEAVEKKNPPPADDSATRIVTGAPPQPVDDGPSKTADVADYIDELIKSRDDVLADGAYYIVEDRDSWKHRVSFFYGVSVGNFSGGGLDSAANVVGIGYDFAPQLAFLLGWAFYDVEENGVTDTDSGLLFGVSLNLNAFRSLTSAVGGS